MSCLSNKKQQNRSSFIGDELSAFDLTWRNYVPSMSQLCCCNRSSRIQLSDDDALIEPLYYNDHTIYREESIQHYLNTSRDIEFNSVFNQDPNQITTRIPYGKHKKNKKRKMKKNKLAAMETDFEEDLIGYSVERGQYYYNDDAEFLADDQIANLVYKHQQLDEHGDIISEMQPPRQFYATRTMPKLNFHEQEASSSIQPLLSAESERTLLSTKLDDLREKLAFIKNHIIQIRPNNEEEDDENYDQTTLHTIHAEEQHISDIDSITSEALDVYETTSENNNNNKNSRYSTNDLHLPSLSTLISDQHSFDHFTDLVTETPFSEQEDADNELNVKNVFNIGRKWLGV